MVSKPTQVVVDDRPVKVTNLDKVLYPATGTTKGEVLAYYQAVAPWFIPHAAGRIATRKRWPNGVGTPEKPGNPFFHKNLDPRSTPEWVRTFTVRPPLWRRLTPADWRTSAGKGSSAPLELALPRGTISMSRPRTSPMGTMPKCSREACHGHHFTGKLCTARFVSRDSG